MLGARPCFADADAPDYERGIKVLEEARQERDVERRGELLDEAEAVFRTFLKETPKHPSAYSARSQIGNIFVERARMQMERSGNTDGNEQAEARNSYEQAYENFETLEAELIAVLSKLNSPPLPANPGRLATRDRMRADYLQAQLLMAAVLEESADTYDPQDASRKEILEKAAEEYEDIYKKYRSRLAGLYARLYQGRCLKKLGQCEEALQRLEELLAQPDLPVFVAPKTKAMSLTLEIWLDDSQKEYERAAARGDEWLKQLDEQKRGSRDSLGIQFRLARAHWLLAETLDDDRKKATHQVKARALAEFVAGRAGTFQTEARKLLADIGDVEPPEPRTFAEAKAAGRDVLDEIKEIRMKMVRAGVSVVAVDIEPEFETIDAKPDPLRAKLKEKQAEAIRHFQLALKLTEDQTPKEDVDMVRYFLCYLHYSNGAYEKAAELGDEASRDPDATGACQSAKIALASYMKIYQSQTPKSEKARGVVKRLEALANHILDVWPEEPEAVETLETLAAILAKEDRVEDSVAYLEKVSADSPRRNRTAFRLGTVLCGNYLAASQSFRKQERDGGPGSDVDTEALKRKLAKTRKLATGVLSDAVKRARNSKDITQDVVMGTFSLAQVYLESVDPVKAVSLLEDPTIGPVTLVLDNHPATQRPSLRREICKTAIHLYGALDQAEKAEPLRELLEEDD